MTVFFLLILCFSVFGSDDYLNLGFDDYSYVLDGSNLFEDETVNDITYQFGADNINLFPLVADLDNNGFKDIVVFSGQSIVLLNFSGDNLYYLDSFTLPSHTPSTINNYYSNPVLNDIDDNGFIDIIFVDEYLETIYFLEYNGTHIYNSSELDLGFTVFDSALACDTSVCFVVYDGGTGYGLGFNKTHFSPNGAYNYLGSDNCMPDKQSVVIGNGKFYFVGTNTLGEYRVMSVELNGSMYPINFNTVTSTKPHTSVGTDCGRGDDDFTGLTLGEFDLVTNGYELGLAYMTSDDTFEIAVYDQNLNLLDESPFLDATGTFLSNVFMARVTNEGSNDYNAMCILGGSNQISVFGGVTSCINNVVCSIDPSVDPLGLTYDNLEFQYSESETSPICYNNSYSFVYNNLVHTIESDLNSVSSEILTNTGIYDLSDYLDGGCFLGVCDLELLWINPNMDTSYPTSFVMADVEDSSKMDIVGVSNNSVFYVDDGFVNRLPFLNYDNSFTIPPVTSDWELGTKIYLQAQVTDLDVPSDLVSVRAILYFGENISIDSVPNLNTEYVDSYYIDVGDYASGTFYDTYLIDGNNLRIEEDLFGGNYSFLTYFNFSDIDADTITELNCSIEVKWDSNVTDIMELQVFNYSNSDWFTILKIPYTAVDTFYDCGFNYSLNDIISSDEVLQFRFIDNSSLVDAVQDRFDIDYWEINISYESGGVEGFDVLDTGWQVFRPSNSIFQMTLTESIPELTFDSVLRIMVTDDENNDSFRSYDYYFDVVLNGSTYEDGVRGYLGDNSSDFDDDDDDDDGEGEGGECDSSSDCLGDLVCVSGECVSLPDNDDNAIKDAVNEFSYLTNVPLIVLILLIFGVIIFSVFKETRIPHQIKLPVSIILTMFGFGICLYLGLISVIWLVLLIMIILIVIGVFVIRFIGR